MLPPPSLSSTVLYVNCDHTIFPLALFSTLSVLIDTCFFFHPLLAPCLLLVVNVLVNDLYSLEVVLVCT